MRVCLISREYPPDTGWGGVGAYTFQTANALQRAGHEVEVIALAGRKEKNKAPSKAISLDGGITIHRVDWEEALEEMNLFLISAPSSHFVLKSGIAIWKKFLQIHSHRPFDVVEAPEHLAAGVFHALTKKVPMVLTLHTPHSKFVAENFHSVESSFDNRIICIMERLAILQADLLLAPSIDLATFVAADTGLKLNDIVIVKNPVDTRIFKPEGMRSLTKNENLKVLFVGRLEERKGIQYLAEAIPKVLKACSNVEFHIVGKDTNTAPDGSSMRAYLEKQLESQGITEKVNFTAHVDLAKMPDYYRSADICVIPSLYDNAPYTCIEALSSGKPVIVSDRGGTKEYVLSEADKETGLVVKGADSDELAETIIQLVKDEKRQEKMATNARNYALCYLDTAIYAKNKVGLYKEAIKFFDSKTKNPGLYRKPPADSLDDTLELIAAFDRMIFTVLHKQSVEFRIKHWFRLFSNRPRLALGGALVAFMQLVEHSLKLRNSQLSRATYRLEEKIKAKTPVPYELSRAWAKLSSNAPETLKQEKFSPSITKSKKDSEPEKILPQA